MGEKEEEEEGGPSGDPNLLRQEDETQKPESSATPWLPGLLPGLVPTLVYPSQLPTTHVPPALVAWFQSARLTGLGAGRGKAWWDREQEHELSRRMCRAAHTVPCAAHCSQDRRWPG